LLGFTGAAVGVDLKPPNLLWSKSMVVNRAIREAIN
jgi:hypothetical protein